MDSINFWLILCNWLVPSVTAAWHKLLLGRISLLCRWGLMLYRQSSVVCLSVGRSVTILSRAKTAEPIEMAFGVWISGCPCKGAILRGNLICTANGWLKQPKSNYILRQRNPSFGETLDQVHFSCMRLCWKVTKYGVHILWLTVSGYELFERPSYNGATSDDMGI